MKERNTHTKKEKKKKKEKENKIECLIEQDSGS